MLSFKVINCCYGTHWFKPCRSEEKAILKALYNQIASLSQLYRDRQEECLLCIKLANSNADSLNTLKKFVVEDSFD